MGIGVDTTKIDTVYPGTEANTDGAHCSAEAGCITCGDVALALEVLRVDEQRGLALCRDERDRRETVEIALVLPVDPGDSLLVHAGTAIAHLGTGPAAPGTPGREAEEVAGI